MSRIRTFIAIDIGPDVRRKAKTLVQELAGRYTGVSWVAPENIHLTLKFLGDVEDTQIYEVCRATGQAVAAFAPFSLACRGIGAFPRIDRPRTIWIGVEDRDGRLVALQSEIEQAMADLGFPREMRPFHPHVTIGRVRPKQHRLDPLATALRAQQELELGVIRVEQCLILSSELTREGPSYTVMGRTDLERA